MRRPLVPLRGPLVALVALVATGLALACASPAPGAKGAACDRASDCAGGLFCVDRTCTDDLSKLDGGNPPSRDTGSETSEAGEAGEVGGDADAPAPVDTGRDTGVPPPDTFVADTFVADTFVADTFVADTFVADTATDDAGGAD